MEESMKNEILAAIQGVNIKVDYIQEEIKNINKQIVQMQEQVTKIPKMQKQVAKIPEMQKQITEMQKEVAKIPEMQKQIAEMQKQVAKIPEMQKQIAEMQKQVAKIPEMRKEVAKIPEMQKEIRSISRSVAVIEYEHGDKLKALFDAFTMTKEKIEEQEKINLVHEKKIEKHDLEINYLTAQIQGA